MQNNVIIFGGVFDPPHLGHLSIYKAVIKHLNVAKFIIVPSKNPPLKLHQPIAKPIDRINMTKQMFGQYKNVEVNGYEALQKSNKISYTIDTLRYFHKKYPKAQLSIVVGTDRYIDFKQWKNWQTILKLTKLIVVKRSNEKTNSTIPATFITINPIPTSSSSLRLVPNTKYLDKHVSTYIASHGLYISNQIKPIMSKKRYEHTLRVTKLVVELAKVINKKLVDSVYIAAMYHDVAKEFTDQQVLSLVGKYDHQRFPTVHTLHGVASAQYVKRFFNIQNKSILNAIANHVVPNKNPSMLDMILYCADKLEPGRSKDDVSDINGYISLAKHNLKSAFAKLYKETNAHYN